MDICILKDKTVVPCDLMECATFMQDASNYTVAATKIGDVVISTVFIGMEVNGLHFETMIMGGVRNGETKRLATYDEAEKYHSRLVGEMIVEHAFDSIKQ